MSYVMDTPHRMIWTFGDYSHDGHGKTQVVNLVSNYKPEDIAKAFKAIIAEKGMYPHKWAEDPRKPFPAEKFLEWGMDRDDVRYENSPDKPEEWFVCCPEHYLLLVEFLCRMKVPDLVLKWAGGPPDLQNILAPNGYESWGYGFWDC